MGGNFDGPQDWADAIEAAEKRKDAQLFRDVIGSLPVELPLEQRCVLAAAWADCLAEEFATSVLYAVHEPSATGDARNFHVHALIPTRRLAPSGLAFEVPGKIELYRDALRRLISYWEDFQRACLECHGLTPVLLPPCPTIHLGKNAIALERRQAEKLDKLDAKKTGQPYEPIRRSVPELLAYTGGVTEEGKAWQIEAERIAGKHKGRSAQEPEPSSQPGIFEDLFEPDDLYEFNDAHEPDHDIDVPRWADDIAADWYEDHYEAYEHDGPKPER